MSFEALMEKASMPNVVAKAFERMGYAEEEIKAAKRRHPKKAKELDDSFLLLCPTPILMEFGEKLYRAHVKEILESVAAGRCRMATNAEAAALISHTSTKTPIHIEYSAAFWLAMCEMFGERYMHQLAGEEQAYTALQLKEGKEVLSDIKNTLNRRLVAEEKDARRRAKEG